eukprot:216497-Chlamydomonas_euryale.AAC.1
MNAGEYKPRAMATLCIPLVGVSAVLSPLHTADFTLLTQPRSASHFCTFTRSSASSNSKLQRCSLLHACISGGWGDLLSQNKITASCLLPLHDGYRSALCMAATDLPSA